MCGTAVWRVRNARELTGKIRSITAIPDHDPETDVHARHKRDDERDEAHQRNRLGLSVFDAFPSPGLASAATRHTSNEVVRLRNLGSWRFEGTLTLFEKLNFERMETLLRRTEKIWLPAWN